MYVDRMEETGLVYGVTIRF